MSSETSSYTTSSYTTSSYTATPMTAGKLDHLAQYYKQPDRIQTITYEEKPILTLEVNGVEFKIVKNQDNKEVCIINNDK
jgi:hypothetical protein